MTKGKLLASTMLVSAAAVMGATQASAAKLSLGGFAELWVGYADNEDATGVNNNFDVKQDAEIYFLAEETLNNGMKAGFRFEMEAGAGNDDGGSTGTGFDESFGWLKTKWGQLNIGNNDVATGYVGGVKVVGPVGITKSDAGDWFEASGELNNTDADLGVGDAQNITYFTPRFSGLQLIVSYTPDSSDGARGAYDEQENAGFHNAFSIAAKYSAKLGGAKVSVAAGRTVVENDDATGGDGEAYSASIKVGVGAATITAGWAKEDAGGAGSPLDNFYSAAVMYKVSKATSVSLGWGLGDETDQAAGVADTDDRVISAGIEHKMGKGVTAAASIFHRDVDRAGSADDRDGMGIVGGFKFKF